MRTTIELDRDLEQKLAGAMKVLQEKPATVLRLALRIGLPLASSQYQPPRPEGFFASAYKRFTPRIRQENRYAAALRQKPER